MKKSTKPQTAAEAIGGNKQVDPPTPTANSTAGIITGEFITRSSIFSFLHGWYRPGLIADNNIQVKKEHSKELLDILDTFGELQRMEALETHFCESDDFIAMVDVGANDFHTYVYVLATPTMMKKFCDTAKHILTSEDRDGDYPVIIDYYTQDIQKQIKHNTFSKWTSDFDYLNDDLYPRIDVPVMLKAFLESDETILILTGIPGTGKTSLIKHIMVEFAPHSTEGELTCAYVKEEEILHNSQFWNRLTEADYELVIFDDLDDALSSRDISEKNNFVNNLLSHSDGVFDNATKFIITTNKQIDEIDTALIRPGRCFDMLDMPPLSRDEALTFWKSGYELSEKVFGECFGDMETISQAHVVSEAKREKSDCSKNYLKDQSISIRSTFVNRVKKGPGFF